MLVNYSSVRICSVTISLILLKLPLSLPENKKVETIETVEMTFSLILQTMEVKATIILEVFAQ